MQALIGFVCRVLALSLLTLTAEYLLPEGRIKHTASLAMRLIYIAAISDEIMGIFVRWGV